MMSSFCIVEQWLKQEMLASSFVNPSIRIRDYLSVPSLCQTRIANGWESVLLANR
jgi:hypothetical protein